VPRLISHLDLRVRDRKKATEFYDAFLNLLGAVKEEGKTFTTWQIPPPDAPGGSEADEWFGITEDPALVPNENRVAFDAPSRGTVDAIATYLPAIGATNIEWSEGVYGPNYYAIFFDDLDGNRLEVCHIGP
jgi:catechol 2,3-dioxygenase-like lactoylglutathione lyase family enzyme